MADGFLNRWSRRKLGVESEVAPELAQATDTKATAPETIKAKNTESEAEAPKPEIAQPTMEDAEKMDRFAPDFSAFMNPSVDPAVQQAAMKKLFSDPHFNIMDRLDIYIDDYSIPDPIPMSMLKRMVQSETLGLFRTFEEGPAAKVLGESKEDKAIEPEPTAAGEPDPAEITEASASNVTMPQDGTEVDVPNKSPDQTPDQTPDQKVASLNTVPEPKIE